MVNLYKIVVLLTWNQTKLSLYFSHGFVIFYEFYKFRQNCKLYLRIYFAWRPLELSFSYTSAPGLHKTP
jgi:hypothetical protein